MESMLRWWAWTGMVTVAWEHCFWSICEEQWCPACPASGWGHWQAGMVPHTGAMTKQATCAGGSGKTSVNLVVKAQGTTGVCRHRCRTSAARVPEDKASGPSSIPCCWVLSSLVSPDSPTSPFTHT